MLKLKVILASTRENRKGELVAQWVMKQLEDQTLFATEFLDLRDYTLPYYEDPKPASMLKPPYSSALTNNWAKKVNEADALLVITPEYNHGYPAVLKSALDAIYYEWNNKPVAFISYGSTASGARAVEQLRQVAIELQMAPIREGVHLGLFSGQQVFDDDGSMLIDSYNKKLAALMKQLYWWGEALSNARQVSATSMQ